MRAKIRNKNYRKLELIKKWAVHHITKDMRFKKFGTKNIQRKPNFFLPNFGKTIIISKDFPKLPIYRNIVRNVDSTYFPSLYKRIEEEEKYSTNLHSEQWGGYV
jgi:hypothetical protein